MSILTHLPPFLWIALVTIGVVLGTVAYLILLERKVASWVQDRLGPNRVGPGGLLQPIADGLKFFFKEDYQPGGADKWLFTVAPAVMMLVMFVSLAVIPLGGIKETTASLAPGQTAASVTPWGVQIVSSTPQHVTYRYPFQIASLNIGVLFIIAVLSLGVYGVVVGGWASNNKYSFLGGLRATAQMISYEIPLGLSLLTIVVMFGTLDLAELVDKQAHLWAGFIPAWNVFAQPVAFLMFLVCIHAEANRAPFDLAEAEQELVGGYHTEYSSMRFALFFLSEYMGMITSSAVCVAVFFGGWHLPGLTGPDPANPSITASLGLILLRCLVFFTKIVALLFVFMWVRWSLPRFRFDQLMMLAWRAMIPLSLALLMCTSIVVWLFGPTGRQNMWISGQMAAVLAGMNAALVAAMAVMSMIVPAAPETNKRLKIEGSRFNPAPADL